MCASDVWAQWVADIPGSRSQEGAAQPERVSIRPAARADAPAIATLVDSFARRGLILPRAEVAIRESIGTWIVASAPSGMLGCGSLVAYAEDLAEVRSLAVAPRAQRRGVGTALVRALIDLGRREGYAKLFALTRRVRFFERLGFEPAEVAWFPEKVWRDCAVCPLIDRCDEHAVVLNLDRCSNVDGAYHGGDTHVGRQD